MRSKHGHVVISALRCKRNPKSLKCLRFPLCYLIKYFLGQMLKIWSLKEAHSSSFSHNIHICENIPVKPYLYRENFDLICLK